MKITDIPAKFVLPFANNAGVGYIRTIPLAPSGTVGQASLEEGFPPANFNPVASGGVPPYGQDFNGVLQPATAWNRWQATGTFPPYDSAFQTAVSGYPKGAIVMSVVQFGLLWMSIVDDNVTNPDTGGAGWIRFFAIMTSNVNIYVNPTTGSDTLYDGLSATVSGSAGPFQTLTRALSYVSQFAPSTFGATINLSAGTFSGGGTGFTTASWAHCNVTITGAGATSIITSSGTCSRTLNITGPNNYTLTNFAIGSTSTYASGAVLIVGDGSCTVILGGGITCLAFTSAIAPSFIKCGSATMVISGSIAISGTMGFAGNYGAYFAASGAANLSFGGSPVITITTAVTCGYFVQGINSGLIQVASTGPASFVNPGNVTGQKYQATLNSIINTQGQGTSYFPGTVAGATATGGQYA